MHVFASLSYPILHSTPQIKKLVNKWYEGRSKTSWRSRHCTTHAWGPWALKIQSELIACRISWKNSEWIVRMPKNRVWNTYVVKRWVFHASPSPHFFLHIPSTSNLVLHPQSIGTSQVWHTWPSDLHGYHHETNFRGTFVTPHKILPAGKQSTCSPVRWVCDVINWFWSKCVGWNFGAWNAWVSRVWKSGRGKESQKRKKLDVNGQDRWRYSYTSRTVTKNAES